LDEFQDENLNAVEYTLFHALYGNARRVHRDLVTFLQQNRKEQFSLSYLRARIGDDELRELFDANFLLDSHVNETDIIDDLLQERAKRLPSGAYFSVLQLVLTNSCNFSCEGCFAYNFDGAVAERKELGESIKPGKTFLQISPQRPTEWNPGIAGSARNPSTHMSFSVAEQTVTKAVCTRKENGGDSLSISFFGGEPTLNRKVISHVLNTFGNEHEGIRLSYHLTTNGSLMPRDLAELLAQYGVSVGVSIDYLDLKTGHYRAGGEQSTPWSTVKDTIELLIQVGANVRLASVLSLQTWNHWNTSLIDFASEAGIQEVDVTVAFQAREFFAQHQPKHVAERLLSVYRHAKLKGVQLTGYWYHTYRMLVDEATWAAQADYKTCPAIGRKLSIEPSGSVFACKTMNQSIGKVDAWKEIFASPGYRKYGMRAYRNGPGCEGCELEGTCSGGSAGALEEENGSIYEMSPGYCEYIRAVVHGLLDEHSAAC